MDGLIEQAKSQLWKIVNQLATSRKDGEMPELQVGLYEYGKDSIPKSEGYLRMISQFTNDLDLLSEELFKLKTNGGSEYCGLVIDSAVDNLKWSDDNSDLKIIFIAGNEPFNQGNIEYKTAVKKAIEKSIIVNTIFCGNYTEGVKTFWKDGADRADGKYINIDHNYREIAFAAPQDTEIIRLNSELNSTYLGYGKLGAKSKSNQLRQDSNAKSLNSNIAAQRVMAKASAVYTNANWDIVDALEKDKETLYKLDENELPEELKKLGVEQREGYVKDLKIKRGTIQKKISEISGKRDKYISEQRKNNSEKITLDSAMITAIKEQAEKKNYLIK